MTFGGSSSSRAAPGRVLGRQAPAALQVDRATRRRRLRFELRCRLLETLAQEGAINCQLLLQGGQTTRHRVWRMLIHCCLDSFFQYRLTRLNDPNLLPQLLEDVLELGAPVLLQRGQFGTQADDLRILPAVPLR